MKLVSPEVIPASRPARRLPKISLTLGRLKLIHTLRRVACPRRRPCCLRATRPANRPRTKFLRKLKLVAHKQQQLATFSLVTP